ncbi:glycerol kinase isoform X9 [Danio rerio]|uniref:Glycerol kinase isoform X9 n=1 Tax=Danio rerio TaxID=7955 RepID=A0AC58J706_DANRE
MDPFMSEQSLQKTSPTSDPAAMQKFSTALQAQAQTLSVHQQQLTHLTEELVKALQGLNISAQSPIESFAFNAPPSENPSAAQNPRLALPEKYGGNPAKCKGFLLQCQLFISQQPYMYTTEKSKIAFVCSLLTDKALEWATAIWQPSTPTFATFASFLQKFRTVFEHPEGGRSAGEELLTIQQGNQTAADFALQFRTLAAKTGWLDDTLKTLYRKGLNPELQTELACRDEGKTLDQFIELSILLDNLIRARKPLHSLSPLSLRPRLPANNALEPMQIGHTPLTSEERERRFQFNLCMYCGLPGHIKARCPVRPSSRSLPVSSALCSSINNQCIEVPISLTVNGTVINLTAIIDSGAAGNFMDKTFADDHNIPLFSCSSPISVLPRIHYWH